MRHRAFKWVLGLLGIGMALLISSAPVEAGSVRPPTSNALLGEFSSFVADFNDWNVNHDSQPLLILERTPDQQRGEAVFLLFWLWLYSPRDGAVNEAPPYSPQAPMSLGNFPSAPPTLNGPVDPPIGSIVTGQTGGEPLLPSSSQGNVASGIGDNPSSVSSLGDLPPQNFGLHNLQEPGGTRSLSPNDSPAGPSRSFGPTLVPEPADFTLLGTGAISCLTYWMARRRMARS